MDIYEYIEKFPDNKDYLHLFCMRPNKFLSYADIKQSKYNIKNDWHIAENITDIKMIRVTEDWCPNYPGNYVLVALVRPSYGNPYRIIIKGLDDFKMEKFFGLSDVLREGHYDEVKEVFNAVVDDVTMRYLNSIGFIAW